MTINIKYPRITIWQEAAQKDTKRAFGNLKIFGKFVSFPIEIRSLNDIENRILTALILHNVVISNGAMGDVNI